MERISIIVDKVNSKQFRDGLSGIYGYIDMNTFEKHKKLILSFRKN